MASHQANINDIVAHTHQIASGETSDGKRKTINADIYFRSQKIFFDVWVEGFAGPLTYDTLEKAVAKYNEY